VIPTVAAVPIKLDKNSAQITTAFCSVILAADSISSAVLSTLLFLNLFFICVLCQALPTLVACALKAGLCSAKRLIVICRGVRKNLAPVETRNCRERTHHGAMISKKN